MTAELEFVNGLRSELDRQRRRVRQLTLALHTAETAIRESIDQHGPDELIAQALADVRDALRPPPDHATAAPAQRTVTFDIPPGTPEKKCRSCNAPMFWIKTTNAKAMPLNPDGTSHFSSCPQAADHRKPRTSP